MLTILDVEIGCTDQLAWTDLASSRSSRSTADKTTDITKTTRLSSRRSVVKQALLGTLALPAPRHYRQRAHRSADTASTVSVPRTRLYGHQSGPVLLPRRCLRQRHLLRASIPLTIPVVLSVGVAVTRLYRPSPRRHPPISSGHLTTPTTPHLGTCRAPCYISSHASAITFTPRPLHCPWLV